MQTATLFEFERTYADDVPELNEPWPLAPVADPRLLVLNDGLARSLGLDPARLRTDGVGILVGNEEAPGSVPIAQAYAGHQFGGYSPRLGDGRAVMLGELVGPDGRRVDLQLKGSGRTPFARGGDGRAAVGPMLREYVFGEAMHALGVPTTRMLSVVATGEPVRRDRELPGAVLARVASSHLRVGTFQYAASTRNRGILERLLDHAARRHHPSALERADAEGGVALAFFEAVLDVQIRTVARWMALGFVHGVMNTDNVTISGETIDYGPCAFMEAYEPATVFSSIDHGGRYAYGNQPPITAWNLARLAESLLPLMSDDDDRAVELATAPLEAFGERYAEVWRAEVAAKLGLTAERLAPSGSGVDPAGGDGSGLDARLLTLFHVNRIDWTSGWRSLSSILREEPTMLDGLGPLFDAWRSDWLAAVDATGRPRPEVADELDRVNPKYIVRNHVVEAALSAASDEGDLGPFERLVAVTTRPFDDQPGAETYAEPAPPGAARHVTFCGT